MVITRGYPRGFGIIINSQAGSLIIGNPKTAGDWEFKYPEDQTHIIALHAWWIIFMGIAYIFGGIREIEKLNHTNAVNGFTAGKHKEVNLW